jgi:LacI family transcriptional regulator
MTDHATIKDVAREAGVSSATVSYVFNSKKPISPHTKAKVMAAIEKLNYVPNINARTLSTNDSLLIGVLIPQTEPGSHLMFENTFYSEILSAIEFEARTHGYHILISGINAGETYMNRARGRNLDGIIAIGVYPDDLYREIKKSGIPLVLIDSYCDDAHCHNIRIDDVYGSYLATGYLLDRGHRDIAFLSGRLRDNGVMKKRLTGYQQALEERGIPFKKVYIFEGKIDFNNGVTLAQRLLAARQPISAVFAAADILAIGAMKTFFEKGLQIPRDISIIGFDDLQISRYMNPGLTTIGQEITLKGKKAVELLVQIIKEPDLTKREEILPLGIIERGSVCPFKKS